ncbi:MAG TPA: PAS domain-containing protein, partial [Methylococcaceae bacterium]|nr:PAS domain-containing protein [Methylococcaceae bacterium]
MGKNNKNQCLQGMFPFFIIFGTDSEGRINEWNQMAAKITGFEKAEVLGVNLVQKMVS